MLRQMMPTCRWPLGTLPGPSASPWSASTRGRGVRRFSPSTWPMCSTMKLKGNTYRGWRGSWPFARSTSQQTHPSVWSTTLCEALQRPGVTHISVSKTPRGWKRQSLSLNTNRNLGWALQKNQKAGDFLQLPFYKPHLFRFIFKSLLFAEHIQCTAEGWVLKRLRPRQWPRDNARDHCFYFSLLFRELCWLNCFPYFRALGESQPCEEHMWSFFWLLLHWRLTWGDD